MFDELGNIIDTSAIDSGGGSGLPGDFSVADNSLLQIADATTGPQATQAGVGGLVQKGAALVKQYGGQAMQAFSSSGATTVAGGPGRVVIKGWPRRKLARLVKLMGLGGAAAALGVDPVILASVALGGRRRGRGISSRDVRTTRRVVGFMARLSHLLHTTSHSRGGRRISISKVSA